MTTKEQERQALAKIKKIVESLGEDSYIGTAFEGVWEIAENNIENDWACSVRGQAESYEKQIDILNRRNNTLDLDCRDLRLAVKKAKEDHSKEVTALREEMATTRRMVLQADIMKELYCFFDDEIEKQGKIKAKAAEIMASFADTPTDIAFTGAVKSYRYADEKEKQARRIFGALEKTTKTI